MSTPCLDQSLAPLLNDVGQASALLADVLQACTDQSLVATDADSRIVIWSPGAARLYGFSADEALGRSCFEVLQLTEAPAQLCAAVAREGGVERTVDCVRPTGERFTARVVVSARRNAASELVGLVLSSTDVSHQVQLTSEARRAKQDFLANMSHELRTPLNAIIGFSELLYDGKIGELDGRHRQYIGHVLTSSRQLLQLINDVLDLAKVESGHMIFAADPVDLDRLARQVRDVLRSMAARKRLVVRIDIDPRLGQVIADAARLKQILYNYLSNAIKFTPDGGRITVRMQPEGEDMFRISVEDTGIGVPAEDLGRLFVEFQQLDPSTAKLQQGTGLGLALTRRIVEAQGGMVDVRSAPGQGSTFSATLPRHSEAPTIVMEPAGPESTSETGPVILVVEDDPSDRAFLQRTFSHAGYVVHTASTVADALSLSQQHQFSAITLDLVLPDGHGLDVVRSIRTSGPNLTTPVLIVSMLPDEGITAAFPVHGFVSKPLEPGVLVREVARIGSGASVLVLSDDPNNIEKMAEHLRQLGYRPIHAAQSQPADSGSAASPRAVVVDPSMLSGRAAGRLGQSSRPPVHETPIIAWASNGMPAAEQAQLDLSLRSVVLLRSE